MFVTEATDFAAEDCADEIANRFIDRMVVG